MTFYNSIFLITLLFIAIEYFYIRKNRLTIYSWKENIITLLTFLGSYFAPLLGEYIPLSPQHVYQLYQEYLRIPELYSLKWSGPEWLRWGVLLLSVDLAYYVSHRLGHKINFFWAGHFTHHTISNLNIIAAHRDPIRLLKIGPTLVLIPIAAQLPWDVGVEVSAAFLFVGVYSTWIHSAVIPRLPYIDWILNTPSHHRMHHSLTNTDRTMAVNFGGVLIIWDRLFGTFLAEKSNQHVYGVQNFHKPTQLFPVLFFQWRILFIQLVSSRTINEALHAIFGSGEYKSREVSQSESQISFQN